MTDGADALGSRLILNPLVQGVFLLPAFSYSRKIYHKCVEFLSSSTYHINELELQQYTERVNRVSYNYSDDYSYSRKSSQKRKTWKKVIQVECGHNPQDAIFEIDDGVVKEHQSFILDRLTIDTSDIFKPLVKIEFSSLVMFEGEDEETYEPEVEVDLLFKLERVCNGVKEVIQSWRYLKEFDVEDEHEIKKLELEIEISEPFTVTFCDRGMCPGCCEYRMVVEGKDFEGSFEFLRVVKPVLTAIIQGHIPSDY